MIILQSIKLRQCWLKDERIDDISSVDGMDGVADVVMIIVNKLLVDCMAPAVILTVARYSYRVQSTDLKFQPKSPRVAYGPPFRVVALQAEI